MASPGDIEPFLEFLKAKVHVPDDLETMAAVLDFMREGTALMGHTSGPPEIVDINMHEKQNAKTNNTESYKVIYGEYPFAVLRRGNVFKVGIRFNQSFELGSVPLRAIFTSEDPVYLKDDAQRNFYTMKETGAYYYGTEKNFGGVKNRKLNSWHAGANVCEKRHLSPLVQFEKVTLATIEFLLKAVAADGAQRSDCVSLVRALCAAINVQDDQGLLTGRWSDDYSAGTSPSVWSSTMPILNKYMENGGNSVKYGQCFVFASALVTVLRALGIPSRSVSNFPSAHVEGDDMSLDFYFDEKNKPIEGADMEWNFHVWTEAWMARPDLPVGYGGWQAVDSTPQIVSEGMYKVGPYPVKAIRENKTDLKHDGKYLSASVKAVYRYHKKDPSHPKGWKLVYEKNNMCGRLLLTEKFNPNGGRLQPDDITHTYKGPTAQPRGATTDVIQVRLEHDKQVAAGQSGRVLCTLTNNDLQEHRVGLALTAYSAPYSNVRPNALVSAQRDFCLQPGASDTLELLISPESYVSKLCPEGMILLEAIATYGDDFTTARSNLAIQMPQLDIQIARKEAPVGALTYKLTMRNPLNVALSSCELTVELPGSTAFLEKITLNLAVAARNEASRTLLQLPLLLHEHAAEESTEINGYGTDDTSTSFVFLLFPFAIIRWDQRHLLDVFNGVLRSGCLPESLRCALVVPVLKRGKPPRSLASYRPVSLTSVPGKTMEAMALSRLQWIADICGVFPPEQCGFRAHRSTADCLAAVVGTLEQTSRDGHAAYLLLLDVQSAFDSLPHATIISAVRAPGVRAGLPRRQNVCCSCWARDQLAPFSDVRCASGECIEPLLVQPRAHQRVRAEQWAPPCMVYANDVALFVCGPPSAIAEMRVRLQAAVDAVGDFLRPIGLRLSAAKSEAIMVHPRAAARRYTDCVVADGVPLPWRLTVRYLGLTVDHRLTWYPAVKQLRAAMRRVEGAVRALLARGDGCRPRSRLASRIAELESNVVFGPSDWPCTYVAKFPKPVALRP
ncbi:hypothetical protein HPB49_016872 [Dermacentor silvarum]|uniref:Uncharacterized protein n=1 Tax=Dermacentor silvarum TaxID=543639 RepID=A0ACB8E1A5_DERSI|nr:hypothetical protein HPB49_016872 [Dermacentor silvarum]